MFCYTCQRCKELEKLFYLAIHCLFSIMCWEIWIQFDSECTCFKNKTQLITKDEISSIRRTTTLFGLQICSHSMILRLLLDLWAPGRKLHCEEIENFPFHHLNMGKQSDLGLLICHCSVILFAFSYSEPFQFLSEYLWEILLWYSVNQESLTNKELAVSIQRWNPGSCISDHNVNQLARMNGVPGLIFRLVQGWTWDFKGFWGDSEFQFTSSVKK